MKAAEREQRRLLLMVYALRLIENTHDQGTRAGIRGLGVPIPPRAPEDEEPAADVAFHVEHVSSADDPVEWRANTVPLSALIVRYQE